MCFDSADQMVAVPAPRLAAINVPDATYSSSARHYSHSFHQMACNGNAMLIIDSIATIVFPHGKIGYL